MNLLLARIGRRLIFMGCVFGVAALAGHGLPASAQDTPVTTAPAIAATNTEAADKAWKALQRASVSPMPPPEWQKQKPSREEVAKFYIGALHAGADKAKDFYAKFPNHPKAAEARTLEYKLLTVASQRFGDTSQGSRLDVIEGEHLKDPNLSEDERLKIRISALERMPLNSPAESGEFFKAAQSLQKDFPNRPEVYQVIAGAAMQADGDTSRKLAQLILDSPAPDASKEQARGIIAKMEALGKPLNIQFEALDGRAVDLATLKGKVVMVDFWATWCGPCVGEVPNVKAAYKRLHANGFEIVGISLDSEKDKLENFVKENDMAWPQYFDGQGWTNKISMRYGINSIPAMWLVDKQGKLRDMNGRDGLEEKVQKLLAE